MPTIETLNPYRVLNPYRLPPRQKPLPVCPVCGGLECLCRPRFFAGQLLTENDLQALDHYIVEKNKLHNRYLHGAGVVCGLEVTCHECKGQVTIHTGYAIDQCGNDIIVCKDVVFDVCAKIRQCCAPRSDWDCELAAAPPAGCREAEQSWFITLRYVENESRGIAALKEPDGSKGCSRCGCGCGGSVRAVGCNCGCHKSSANGHGHAHDESGGGCGCGGSKPTRPTVQQCEATRVCESFVVELMPAPPPPDEEGRFPNTLFAGTLLSNWTECKAAAELIIAKAPQDLNSLSPGARVQACCDYKRIVWEFLTSHSLTHCALLSRLNLLECPPDGGLNATQQVIDQLIAMVEELEDACFCHSILPPCPAASDPRVILGKVTVRGENCEVIDICNLSGRRFVWTWPNAFYWFSFGGVFKKLIELMCCEPRYWKLGTVYPRDQVIAPAGMREMMTTAPHAATPHAAAAAGTAAHGATEVVTPQPPRPSKRLGDISKILPLLEAASARSADPLATLRTAAQLLAQGAEGFAYGNMFEGAALTDLAGVDLRKAINLLKKSNPGLELREQEENWPLELWTLQQVLQPFLAPTENHGVAHTIGGKIAGFTPDSIADLRKQVADLTKKVEELGGRHR